MRRIGLNDRVLGTRVLAVIPSYARTEEDLDMLRTCLRTLRRTAKCDALVVDDGGPLEGACAIAKEHGADSVRTENRGFSRAVNVGLVRAHAAGEDAVLVNSDIQFHRKGWLEAMDAVDAGIVGALLLYPHGVVQHAGIGYSPLMRAWSERLKYAPADLPAVHEPRDCPVTGALQLVRASTIDAIGFYDESFRLGWEDVDFCLRAWKVGIRCAYAPDAVAYHHESFSRGRRTERITRWTNESWERLQEKHKGTDFSGFPLHG